MTTQIETNATVQNPSHWKKIQSWLTNATNAIDYDPQAHVAATINGLKTEVLRLGNRVSELEEHRDANKS